MLLFGRKGKKRRRMVVTPDYLVKYWEPVASPARLEVYLNTDMENQIWRLRVISSKLKLT